MSNKVEQFTTSLSDVELINCYSEVHKEFKRRKIVRTNNVVGELGEYLAVNYYNSTKGLPKLQLAPPGTQNIDAISRAGDRYSIKSTTGKVTGVFYGLNSRESAEVEVQKFEFVILILLNEDFSLKQINELTWGEFIKYKKWHSRMSAWNLPVNKTILAKTKVIFQSEE